MVATDYRLMRALRQTVSPALVSKDGKKPLDQLNHAIDVVIIQRFYPEQNALMVEYRDMDVEPFIAMCVGMYPPDQWRMWVPTGTPTVCPDTGWNCIYADKEYVGIVANVGGDHGAKGSVFLGFVRMQGMNLLDVELGEIE